MFWTVKSVGLDPGYVYKLRLAVEVFKVTPEVNSRLILFFTFAESKRKG